MQVRTVRRPGEKGTRKLLERYGDRLVCVRYRVDPQKGRCYKTMELIVHEAPWVPPPVSPNPDYSQPPPQVALRIGFHETELRRQIKAAGARWDPDQRLWYLAADLVTAYGLEARIVKV